MDRALITGMLKDWLLALVILLAVMGAWNLMSAKPPATGGNAPDIVLVDDQLGEWKLSAQVGPRARLVCKSP